MALIRLVFSSGNTPAYLNPGLSIKGLFWGEKGELERKILGTKEKLC
jgi:hypothetical protein